MYATRVSAIQRFQIVVDQTLGTLFPNDRQTKGVILARITESEGQLECDLRAPDEYLNEIVGALHSRLTGWEYVLKVRPL